ncbi:MAG: RIP metalloprotease RseP, partial [Candidatus Dormibacteria bacterium]
MNEFFGSVWWLIVTLGLLITFHEFGHFVVARRCGVKVLKFSVGFGKALWSRHGKDGTEFAIAAVPLGGYVKMLDEREGDVAPAELDRAFNRKPVLQRMAIAAAGPAFNLIFAMAAFWLMFVVGKPDFLPIVDTPTGLAASAGFEVGDRLTAIDGRPVHAWSQAIVEISQDAIARNDARIAVTTANDHATTRTLGFSTLPRDLSDNQLFERMGLSLKPPAMPAVVGRLSRELPAAAAGLKIGDRITRINGQPVADFRAIETLIPQQAAKSPRLDLVVQRGNERLELAVTAVNQPAADGKPHWVIGIGSPDPHDALLKYGPLAAIPAA